MRKAIELSRENVANGGGPFGAVIAKDGEIVATGVNRVTASCDPTAHAEILAIKKASAILGNWRLTGCSLYVTIEPCPMCAGAAVNAHLSSIIYGAPNPRYGGIDSKFRIVQNPFNHAVSVIRGVCQSECQQLMDEFFDDKRHLSM